MPRPKSSPDFTAIARCHAEVRVRASLEKTFKTLTRRADEWWPTEMRIFGDAGRMEFVTGAGGCLLERGPNGSEICWGITVAIEPPRVWEWVSYLTPRFGGPAMSMVKIELKDVAGETLVRLDDASIGPSGDALQESQRVGWLTILQGLKAHLGRKGKKRGGSKKSTKRRPRG